MMTDTVRDDNIIKVRFQTVLIPLTITDGDANDDDRGDIVVKLSSLKLLQSENRFLQPRLCEASTIVYQQ